MFSNSRDFILATLTTFILSIHFNLLKTKKGFVQENKLTIPEKSLKLSVYFLFIF